MFDFPPSPTFRLIDRMLIGLALLFGAALIVANAIYAPRSIQRSDQFDSDLQSITSVNSAIAYVKGTRVDSSPVATANAVDAFVRKRFVHGYSEFTPGENWIAFAAGFFWVDLRQPVLPNDILRHRRGACSQQAIVFEAVARQLGLNVGSVGLAGHFLPAVRIGNQWLVYDPDREIEPNSYPLAAFMAGDPRIEERYGEFGRRIGMVRQARASQIRLVDVNANPAPQASLFHDVTHFFSHYGWAVFLGLFVALNAARGLWANRRLRTMRDSANAVPWPALSAQPVDVQAERGVRAA